MHLDAYNYQKCSSTLPLSDSKEEDRKEKLAFCECNKLSENNNIIRNMYVEQSMPDKTYTQLEIARDEMKVILEFPQDTGNEDLIKEEIHSILINTLQEQLGKTT